MPDVEVSIFLIILDKNLPICFDVFVEMGSYEIICTPRRKQLGDCAHEHPDAI